MTRTPMLQGSTLTPSDPLIVDIVYLAQGVKYNKINSISKGPSEEGHHWQGGLLLHLPSLLADDRHC